MPYKTRRRRRRATGLEGIGVAYLFLGGISLAFVLLAAFSSPTQNEEDRAWIRFAVVVGGGYSLLFLFAGIGLLKGVRIAAAFAGVVGVLSLFHIPFGTILGILTLKAISEARHRL